MFGFFNSKATSTKYQQLGKGSADLITISQIESDLDLLMKGSSEIFSTIEAAEHAFGLKLTSRGLFMNFLDAAENDDAESQEKYIRYFGRELQKKTSEEERGRLIEYWIQGRPQEL